MKNLKYLFSLLLVVCMFTFAACSSKAFKSASDVEKVYNDTISAYSNASNCQVKVTLQNGEKTQTIDLKYSYNGNKINSLAAVLTNAEGEVSVYVVDGVAYMARYNSDKVYYTITDAEQATITAEYNFDKFLEELKTVYSASFFKASSLDEATKTSAKLTCDTSALEVDESLDGEAYFAQQDEIEKLQAMESVKLEVSVNGDKLTKLVGTYVSASGVTSVITVEFLGTDAASITVPNQSSYVAK